MSESLTIRPPRAYRLFDRALVAGVSAGLAAHSRIPVWGIRAAFVLASAWKLSGAVAYAMLWLLLPSREKVVPIGLVAAARQGRRTVSHPVRWTLLAGWAGSFIVGVGFAALIRYYDTTVLGRYAILACLGGLGIGLVWLTREISWPYWVRGVVVVVGAAIAWIVVMFAQARFLQWFAEDASWGEGDLGLEPGSEVFAAALFVGGTTVIAGIVAVLPWILHPARTEEAKQAELITQTRADMAAHLHDSVLQTLAVIQKRASDPKIVAQLARRQERELREWLYGELVEDESATTALKDVVAELEAAYPVAVELVTVGDHEMVVEIDAVVKAAREAVLNAAKHSGVDKIDVYAEITDGKAEVFVRDRGQGFSVADIGEDRMGIRGSILNRMQRYGGTVDIRSTVGEGTEIHLAMPLSQEGVDHD